MLAPAKKVKGAGTPTLLTIVLGNAPGGRRLSLPFARLIRDGAPARQGPMKPDEIRRRLGTGAAVAVRLSAAFELGRRVHGRDCYEERPRIARPREAWAHVRDLRSARKEHLVGLYLDAQNHLIARETISIGSLNTTRTHPREILQPAIACSALNFILVHNHPSGSLTPSQDDIDFPRAIQRATQIIGIGLNDHLIVSASGFVSLKVMGLL